MSGHPWYAFYPDAYERDAAHLSYVQDSAYRRMLDHYYKTGGPLPLDRDTLYRACRALRKEERHAIDFILSTFFKTDGDGYHQPRADAEIKRAAEISAKRSIAANKRHGKTDAIAHASEGNVDGQLDTHSTATSTTVESSLRSDSKPPVQKPYFEFPEWIPKEAWDAFIEMRTKIKAKPTQRGVELLIAALRKLRHSDDIGAVLDQSIMNNWKGVFSVKHANGGRNGGSITNQSFGSSLARRVDARSSGGLLGERGAEIVVPAGAARAAGDRDDDERPGHAADAA